MKILSRIAFWLIVFSLPALLIASNIRFAVNSISVYEYCIQNYNISQATGIDKTGLEKIYQHWIDFYSSKVDSPQISITKINGEAVEVLSQNEVTHMEDVKKLMVLDTNVQIVSLIIFLLSVGFLIYRGKEKKWQLLLSSLFRGSLVSFAVIALVAVASFFNFNQVFILFHVVSFSNDFWILPPDSYLIRMFPEAFFNFIFIFVFGVIILESVVLGGIAFTLGRWLKKRDNISEPDKLTTSAGAA